MSSIILSLCRQRYMTRDIDLFFESIRIGDKYRLEALLGINPGLVNTRDSRGFTPLIFATYFENEEITNFLIEKNADINAQDNSGNTALIGVCFKGNATIVNLLIKKGADINATNNNGSTPLIFATLYDKENIVNLLLNAGANKSIKDFEGKTAYDYALEKEYCHFLKLLNS
ncbi:ankyrin repeat domain-containing protein [Pontimicrobium sp. SW4]|uniref:Ankyrin repeat domain-containing protein n=1 Tax=Pontimicrobium sp. SW4 TaxID=3153519 RepID=A0AAU7BWW2_9FLAO